MVSKILNMLNKLRPSKTSQKRFTFMDVGFHGDLYFLELVDTIMNKCKYFVETGTNVGSTLTYVAKKYPEIQCFSCETDMAAFEHARQNTLGCGNVQLFNKASLEFLEQLFTRQEIGDGEVLFWLDAHGYGFDWPLREEVAMITAHQEKAFLFIDDFLVPGMDCFGYDEYNGQVCSLEYIKDSLNNCYDYSIYYPQYTDRTSQSHPLRGWGLIDYGHSGEMVMPVKLKNCIKKEQ
jgi:hypothetical protein